MADGDLPDRRPALRCRPCLPDLGPAALVLLCGPPAAGRRTSRRRAPAAARAEAGVSDEALLAAIRPDLARSPWTGEGHRKVWARLRVIDGIRVARNRVLRLMREHGLLSPHRARTRPRRRTTGGSSPRRRT